MELRFDGTEISMDLDFHGYSDAGWSQDPENSWSTSDFLFMSNCGAISWSSKQQSMVALFTTKLEYIALSNAGQHLTWLQSFFNEIGHTQKGPTKLFSDNQAAIILCHDPQFRAQTKHIQQKYHFVRDDLVGKGEAVVHYIPTGDMVADILTKPLVKDQYWKFVKAMGLQLYLSGSDSIHT